MKRVHLPPPVVALALVVAACSPTAPAPPPPPPPGPTVTNLAISGPDTVEPRPLVRLPEFLQPHGAAQQFRATAAFSDGSSKDVTANAEWQYVTFGLPSLVLALWPTNQPGLVESGRPGDAIVAVKYGGKSATHHVLVIAPGTFRLSGMIRTSDGQIPRSASTHIMTGKNEGLHSIADPDGHYTIYGVAGPTVIRLGADGYPSTEITVDLASDATQDVTLTAYLPPAADLSGNWAYTLKASPLCRDQLPAAARERSYDITIVQTGSVLNVTLFGPAINDFDTRTGRFDTAGSLHGDDLDIGIAGDTDWGDWSSVRFNESLSSTAIVGLSIASIGKISSGSEIVLPTTGDIEYWDVPYRDDGRPNAMCRATDHTAVLRRR